MLYEVTIFLSPIGFLKFVYDVSFLLVKFKERFTFGSRAR